MLNRFSLAYVFILSLSLSAVFSAKADLGIFYENNRYNFMLRSSDDFFKDFDISYLSDNGDGITLFDSRKNVEVRIFGAMTMEGDKRADDEVDHSDEKLPSPNFPFVMLDFRETSSDEFKISHVLLTPGEEQLPYTLHIEIREENLAQEGSESMLSEIIKRLYHKNH